MKLRRGVFGAATLRLASLILAAAFAAPAATFYLTMSGLGGEPDYDQRFKGWATEVDSSLKKAGGDSNVITLIAPTIEQIRKNFADLAAKVKPNDALVVLLIGHGTFDGVDYKFNIPGPDITGAELAVLMDKIPATRQLVVNATSCSGASIEFLRKANRIVITATKTGTEKNATVFARYWAEALREPSADIDKNESVSALEAFHYAQKKTKEFFDTQKRLATEHSILEDTGKGMGVRDQRQRPRSGHRRGPVGGRFHGGPPGRQRRRGQGPGEESPARQEGRDRTGHRPVEIRKGRNVGRRLQETDDPSAARTGQDH